MGGLSRQLLVVTICDDPNQPDDSGVGGIYNNYLYIIITITNNLHQKHELATGIQVCYFWTICATTAAQ